MRQEGYVFTKEDARTILREAREAKQAAFRAQRELEKIRYQFGYASNVNNIEYYLPLTTLEPGGNCTAILQVWDRENKVYKNSGKYTSVKVYDPFSWCFAVGRNDYASTTSIIPAVQSVLSGQVEVIAPTGLIQQAKPDSTIATGGTGTFSVYQDGTDTTVDVTADVTWGDDGQGVTAGQESWVRWNGAQWELIEADNDDEIGVGKGTLNSALATTDSTIGVTLDANSAVGSGTITANNFCGFSADNGAKCYVSTDGTTWELIQVACPA